MPAALHKRRGPAAGGTEARLKSENENEAPHSYPTFQQEFNRRRQIVPGSARREAALFAKAPYEDFQDCRGRIGSITRGQARPEFVTAERMPWRVQDYAGADDVYLRLNPQG